MTMIDTADSRFAKAVAIADQAAGWAKCHSRDGRKVYGIPSSKGNGRFYLVTQSTCDCEDQRRRPGLACKHRIALAIHCARVAGQPMPASDVVDGLEQMVIDRHPVREADGSIRWERHEHANGDFYYLPRHEHPRPVADASTYERIFGRL